MIKWIYISGLIFLLIMNFYFFFVVEGKYFASIFSVVFVDILYSLIAAIVMKVN